MFLHVCDSVHGGCAIPACIAGGIPACLAAGGCLLRGSALGGVCSGGGLLWGGGWRPPPKADGYCCGRYASYSNAFLFFYFNSRHSMFFFSTSLLTRLTHKHKRGSSLWNRDIHVQSMLFWFRVDLDSFNPYVPFLLSMQYNAIWHPISFYLIPNILTKLIWNVCLKKLEAESRRLSAQQCLGCLIPLRLKAFLSPKNVINESKLRLFILTESKNEMWSLSNHCKKNQCVIHIECPLRSRENFAFTFASAQCKPSSVV